MLIQGCLCCFYQLASVLDGETPPIVQKVPLFNRYPPLQIFFDIFSVHMIFPPVDYIITATIQYLSYTACSG